MGIMTRFEFSTVTKIIFGMGVFNEVVTFASEMGNRVFVVTSEFKEHSDILLDKLVKMNIKSVAFPVTDEPTIEIIKQGVNIARGSDCDIVISIGGGSVIDTGKAIAAFLTNTDEITDYLEVIGKGKPLTNTSVPFIAIPTTAGTGSEVTSNSVLSLLELKVKVSIRSPLLLPRIAIIDPLLTCSMPPSLTATTGIDALTQLIEAFISNKANPMTDPLCMDGINRAARFLKHAFFNGDDLEARENMALASLFSGIALSNAKLGAVHGIAGALGGILPIPHGLICANLLLPVLETNIKALRSRNPDSIVLNRLKEISIIMTGKPNAEVDESITWIKDLTNDLNIPKLSKFGLKEEMFSVIVEKSQKSSSMKGNPIQLTDGEITEILYKVM
jgi:alcohol dehydrogenase class IV